MESSFFQYLVFAAVVGFNVAMIAWIVQRLRRRSFRSIYTPTVRESRTGQPG